MKEKLKQKIGKVIKIGFLVQIICFVLYLGCCVIYCLKNIFGKKIKEDMPAQTDKREINSKIDIKCEGDKDLSIIVPVYNCKEFCVQCLNSVLSQQTSYSYEIIVVDDGSEDGLAEYLKENNLFEKIVYLRIPNSGQGFARNRGLEASSGKRIMFLDADDMLMDGAIEELMGYSEDLVQCGFETFGDQEKPCVHKNILTDKRERILKINCFGEGYPWGKIYSRSLFSDNGFPEKVHFEDNNLCYFILPRLKSYRYINSPFVRYRVHKSQETANVVKNGYGVEQAEVVTYLYGQADKYFGQDEQLKNYLAKNSLFNLTTVLYSRIREDKTLFSQAFAIIREFYSENPRLYYLKSYAGRQFKKMLEKGNLSGFINVCRYL